MPHILHWMMNVDLAEAYSKHFIVHMGMEVLFEDRTEKNGNTTKSIEVSLVKNC